MSEVILVTEGAGFKLAGRLGTFQSYQCRSSDIKPALNQSVEKEICLL